MVAAPELGIWHLLDLCVNHLHIQRAKLCITAPLVWPFLWAIRSICWPLNFASTWIIASENFVYQPHITLLSFLSFTAPELALPFNCIPIVGSRFAMVRLKLRKSFAFLLCLFYDSLSRDLDSLIKLLTRSKLCAEPALNIILQNMKRKAELCEWPGKCIQSLA